MPFKSSQQKQFSCVPLSVLYWFVQVQSASADAGRQHVMGRTSRIEGKIDLSSRGFFFGKRKKNKKRWKKKPWRNKKSKNWVSSNWLRAPKVLNLDSNAAIRARATTTTVKHRLDIVDGSSRFKHPPEEVAQISRAHIHFPLGDVRHIKDPLTTTVVRSF